VTARVRYPAPLGSHVKCNVPTRRSAQWKRFEGRTGVVEANRAGEIAVALDGSAGTQYWFLASELVKWDVAG
jgi:hypothetical protein